MQFGRKQLCSPLISLISNLPIFLKAYIQSLCPSSIHLFIHLFHVQFTNISWVKHPILGGAAGLKPQLGCLLSRSRLHTLKGLPFMSRIQPKLLARTYQALRDLIPDHLPDGSRHSCLSDCVLITLASSLSLETLSPFLLFYLLHGSNLPMSAQRCLELP